MSFRNLPLTAKLLVVFLAFAILMIGSSAFSISRMLSIQAEYQSLIETKEAGIISVIRGSANFQRARAAIADLVMAVDEKGKAAAIKDLDAAKAREAALLGEARMIDPASASMIDNLEVAFKGAVVGCEEAIRLASASTDGAGRNAAQANFLANCSSQLAALGPLSVRNTDIMNDALEAEQNRTKSDTNKAIIFSVVVTAVGLMSLLSAGVIMVSRFISKPIIMLSDSMRTLANGDFSTVVPFHQQKDEVGAMARALQIFKEAGEERLRLEKEAEASRNEAEGERSRNRAREEEAAREQAVVVKGIAEGLSRLATGDLTHTIATPFPSSYEALREDFNTAVAQLRSAMTEVTGKTEAIRAGANEISDASDDLARRTEQQAASIEQTAAALEEITGTVKATAAGARDAQDMVNNARQDAEQSGVIVSRAVEAMSAIEQSSGQITQIIGVIDEIAFQTNLLALNAGVEAARAGEAGRGFAVVAQEVRALAQRSAEAAKEIKGLISTSTHQVETGVEQVNEAGRALNRILDQVSQINTVVSEIAAGAQEQAIGLAEVNTAVNLMDQNTQQNAAMVEQTTAASVSLRNETEHLSDLVRRFVVDGQKPQEKVQPVKLAVGGARGRGGAAAQQARLAAAIQDWEEF